MCASVGDVVEAIGPKRNKSPTPCRARVLSTVTRRGGCIRRTGDVTLWARCRGDVQQHRYGGSSNRGHLVGSGSRRLRLSPAETKDSPGDARGKGLSEHPPPSGCPRELTWVAPRAWAERRDILRLPTLRPGPVLWCRTAGPELFRPGPFGLFPGGAQCAEIAMATALANGPIPRAPLKSRPPDLNALGD